jgi:hypothetical protein
MDKIGGVMVETGYCTECGYYIPVKFNIWKAIRNLEKRLQEKTKGR